MSLSPLKFSLLLALLALGFQSQAQQRQWQDGLYAAFSQFQKNEPNEDLKRLQTAKFVFDNEENIVFLRADSALLKGLWGFCLQNQPYVQVPADSLLGSDAYFVRLKILGRLAYFEYPVWEMQPFPMDVYNPVTGKKMGSRVVHNQVKVPRKRILSLETGQILPFDRAHLRQAIASDAGLVRSLDEQSQDLGEEKLLKVLRIYNDRNPLP